MGKLRARLISFMYGRYGVDQLYYGMLVLSLVIMVINAFVRFFVLDLLVWAILVLMVFRTFSRNIYKRRLENQRFLKFWRPVKSKFSITFARIKEFRTKRYRKCSHCKAMLRLPRKTGKHVVNCPRCHRDFDVRVLW